MDKYAPLLSQTQLFLNDSVKIVDDLISEQEQVNGALSEVIKEGEGLITKVDTQQTQIAKTLDIKQDVENFPVDTQAISALNKKLAPLGLQIDMSAKGMGRFKHNGASVSESSFKGVINTLLANQTQALKGFSDQLTAKQRQITELTAKSTVLGQRIEEARETRIKPALKAFENLNTMAKETLEGLYALKNDKDRWAALSSEAQERLNAMIASQERGLVQANKGTQEISATLDKMNVALKVAEKLRTAGALVFEALGKTSNKLTEGLKNLEKLMGDDKKGSVKAQVLIEAANALKMKLSSPQSSQMAQQWSEDALSWISDVERMNADTQRHQQLQHQSRMDQAALDRSLGDLRENLLYHQDQISTMTEAIRERTLEALTSALQNVEQLATNE